MSDSDEEPYNSMDEVLPGLWIGDISSAIDAETLRARKIHSVLTAMRGRVKIGEPFSHYQIQLDDVEDADALAFFPQCISFIESELEKGRGVLVHCQAGMSRSVTIVAAYLMYAQNVDAAAALDIIRQVRPSMCPNDGFLQQLDIFYQASYKVSRRDKATRMYYLERAVLDILNGDGSIPEDNMFAKFPRTPSDSIPSTPAGAPKRKIRCKMCRQELANREHMLDHGQVGPPTPAVIGGLSPAVSRRPSMHDPTMTHSSRSSVFPLTPLTALSRRSSSTAVQTLTSTTFPPTPGSATTYEIAPLARSRRPSSSSVIAEKGSSLSRRPSATIQQSRSRLGSSTDLSGTLASPLRASMLPTDKASFLRGIRDSLSMSALESDEDSEVAVEVRSPGPSTISAAESRLAMEAGSDHFMERIQETDAEMGDSDKPPLVQSPEPLGLAGRGTHTGVVTSVSATSLTEMSPSEPNTQTLTQVTGTTPSSALHHPPTLSSSSSYFHPHDLAAQLNTNPKLAALRGRSLSGSGSVPPMTKISNAQTPSVMSSLSPPLLINPKCSGYFVEPMKWMESFLEDGRLAGKIICPNKKCGAKLGNYDWAGVCCSCKEWVTPGFCIHRSKVDEII